MGEFLRIGRRYFVFAGVLSFFANVLSLALPVFILVIYDRVLFSYSVPSLVTLSVGGAFSFLVLGVLLFIRERIFLLSGSELQEVLSRPVLDQALLGAGTPGDKQYRALADLDTLRNFMAGGSMYSLFDALWIPLYIIVLFILHPVLGYVSLAFFLLFVFFLLLYNKLIQNRLLFSELTAQKGREFINRCLRNFDIVHGMGMQDSIFSKWKDIKRQESGFKQAADKQGTLFGPLIVTLELLVQLILYAVGAYLFFDDQITGGRIFAAVIIIGLAAGQVRNLFLSWPDFVLAKGAYKRLKICLQNARKPEAMQLPDPEGRLNVESATLVLNRTGVLHNIAFDLEQGEHLSVIGPSASGKTALCRLLAGIWPASRGKVRLDNADILQWDRVELGKHIGYLPQETELFSGTLSENIACLQEVDPDKVIRACKNAGIHDMVLNLPQGYDTPVQAGGNNFSAGQKRLISLARALYNDPVLVILDMPETGMDDMGERNLAASLDRLKKSGVTVVLTTHRPGLITNSDKVLLLKFGQVAMFGPRQEVLAKLAEQQKQKQVPPGD